MFLSIIIRKKLTPGEYDATFSWQDSRALFKKTEIKVTFDDNWYMTDTTCIRPIQLQVRQAQ